MANINVSKGTSTVNGVTRAPRSFADVLTGTSKVSYSRPTKAAPTQKSVTKAFKSYGPTSNGKGVGGL